MDLHQAFKIFAVPDDGIVSFQDPDLAGEASPLVGFVVQTDFVAMADRPEGAAIERIQLPPGKHVECAVPAWSACVLVVHEGFCLTGTDGESPDAKAGQCVVYRRRNRGSALILVAGPEGCRATLVIAPSAD